MESVFCRRLEGTYNRRAPNGGESEGSMLPEQASALRPGDRVIWNGFPPALGTVKRTFYNGLEIEWDDRRPETDSIHVNDCDRLGKDTIGGNR
jgi:hypothetical protein